MLTKHLVRKQAGFSLVELMVGLAIGLIIVAAAASVYITAVRSGADTLRSAKLNMELRSAMDIMVAEIRRAGYTANTTNLTNNPFMQPNTNLTLVGTDCLLFAYEDAGTTPEANFLGFRRNAADDSISMRQGAVSGSNPSTSAGCTVADDSWERITDPDNVVIDTLSFGIDYQCWNAQADTGSSSQACIAGESVYDAAPISPSINADLVEVRDVTITLIGHHKNDVLTLMELTQSVRVRNDRVQTVSAP